MAAHWHLSLMENGRFSGQDGCFTSTVDSSALEAAKVLLKDRMRRDMWHHKRATPEPEDLKVEDAYLKAIGAIDSYDGRTEAIEEEVTVDGVTYGYRIMAIDGDCEESLRDYGLVS